MSVRRTSKTLKIKDYQCYCRSIDNALAALEALGLGPQARERVFSFHALGNKERLGFQLKFRDSTEVHATCRFILKIKKWLDARFGDKTVEMKKWMRVKLPEFNDESLRSILLSGDRAKIKHASAILQRTKI